MNCLDCSNYSGQKKRCVDCRKSYCKKYHQEYMKNIGNKVRRKRRELERKNRISLEDWPWKHLGY